MARTKKAAAATADTPQLTLDEQIKKLLAAGKKRGTLTYEEINAVFDTAEDVAPERMASKRMARGAAVRRSRSKPWVIDPRSMGETFRAPLNSS